MKKALLGSLLCVLGSLSCAHAATYTIDFTEIGGNVVASGSGAIDMGGLSFLRGVGAPNAGVYPHVGFVLLNGGSYNLYSVATPNIDFSLAELTSWGALTNAGSLKSASSSSGEVFGFYADIDVAYIPVGYVSNTPMSSTATWENKSFLSMGMKPGSYVYQLGPNNAVTVNVGSVSSVPVPPSMHLMVAGLGLIALARRRHRKSD